MFVVSFAFVIPANIASNVPDSCSRKAQSLRVNVSVFLFIKLSLIRRFYTKETSKPQDLISLSRRSSGCAYATSFSLLMPVLNDNISARRWHKSQTHDSESPFVKEAACVCDLAFSAGIIDYSSMDTFSVPSEVSIQRTADTKVEPSFVLLYAFCFLVNDHVSAGQS